MKAEIYDSIDDAKEEYLYAQLNGGCSCHISSPCGYCEHGFSLELDEFLSLYVNNYKKITVNETLDNYGHGLAIQNSEDFIFEDVHTYGE